MAVSTVKLNGTTLMTVNDTTATASDVAQSKYFYAANGVKTAGTNSGGGGTSTYANKVYFYDYDGTLLYEYTPEQANALSALPANPSHTGLTAQGWNWTLAQIKDYLEDYPNANINVGQMYITSDGKTRIYIHFENETRLNPYLALCPNGTVTIDWGDNSSTGTLTGTSLTTLKYIQHTYPSSGDYIITLTATSGTFAFYGSSETVLPLLVKSTSTSSSAANQNFVFRNMIKKIQLGSNISIGDRAFRNCSSLTSITIPNNVTSIGGYAFYNCYSLTSTTIPNGVTSIENYAFYNCSSLTSITTPNGVTSIGGYAFENCNSLASITIPNNVTSIGTYAFYDCSSLTSITIPNNVTSIGQQAFHTCYSLASITISNSITSIGSQTFRDCYSLASINIPNNVTSIGEYAFEHCHSLTSITIPNGVTSIGNYAFNHCHSLTSVSIPSSITSIGTYAFQFCYRLTSISIPNSMTKISTYTFSSCYSLTLVNIPSSITSIGTYAFNSGYGIKEIHIESTTPPTLGGSALSNIPADCIIYVPYSADHSILTAYQEATNWSKFTSYMQEEPQ